MKNEPGMAFNMKTLNKVFAVLSVLFVLTVFWVFLDDFIRPWKIVQVKAMQIERANLNAKLVDIDKGIDQTKVSEINKKIQAAVEIIKGQKAQLESFEAKLSVVQKNIYAQKMKNGILGSTFNAHKFSYESALHHNHPHTAEKYAIKVKEYDLLFKEGKNTIKGFKSEEKLILKAVKLLKSDQTLAEKEKTELLGARNRTLASLDKTKIGLVWLMRNAPLGDFLDPTLKISQVEVKVAQDDFYFQQVPKVDRCMTCHVFIEKEGYEDQDNPYKTHPKLDSLAVGMNSPHPMKKFGCTSCHGGEGHRVFDFSAPVHMPEDMAQKKEWEEKYHFHEPHKTPAPMFKLSQTEASCLKCHQGVARIPMAEKYNKGKALIETYGCYGCHKIEGWAHLKKPGPSLLKITSKTSKEWIKNWVWAPQAFNPKSKMPAFFNQSNNSKPEHIRLNVAEVNSIGEYLSEKAKKYKPHMKYTGGKASRGKALIETVGCTGCHMVEGISEEANKANAKKGTYLTGTGSKVNKDWLVSWLKKPSHYDPNTVMPSFRLSDKEANDITAYLMTLKNSTFEGLKFDPLDRVARDELLVEYFAAFDTLESANAKLAKMDDHARTMELGERSIGKYGCYSCHDIDGFKPGRAPIGPELTNMGSKFVTQMGFGIQDIEHKRGPWIFNHLKNPRRWDEGIPKDFKDLVKMPNFYLSDDEAKHITTALLAQVSDPVPAEGMRVLSANDQLAEKGKKVVAKFNCQGCHKIDGRGGNVSDALEDRNEGPPFLVKQGHRVQSEWFYNFLQNVTEIRPWVKYRMPSFNFSNDELNTIVAYFQADSNEVSFTKQGEHKVKWLPGEKAAAKTLWNELACTSCHTGGFNSEEAQAPNLHFAKRRLRASWIKKWLANPTAILGYTPMPAFWDGGESAVEGVLGDDPERQINALVKYIMEMGYNKDPKTLGPGNR